MTILWFFILSLILLPATAVIFVIYQAIQMQGPLNEHKTWASAQLAKMHTLAQGAKNLPDANQIQKERQIAQQQRTEFIDFVTEKGLLKSRADDSPLRKIVDEINANYRDIELLCMELLAKQRNNKGNA